MANGNSAVTVDTDEWVYVDVTGVEHKVTNAETFNIYVTDGAAPNYYIPTGESVVTDDGYTINFRPRVGADQLPNLISPLADAIPATTGFIHPVISGEIDIECPVTGIVQNWRVASLTPSDADYQAAGSIAATFEDQFGNTMSWVAGMDVGQAGA